LVIKYPLLVSLLPADTIFINYPKSFFEKNKKIAEAIFLVSPLLFFLIVGLIVNIIKKIRLEKALLLQSKLDNVLLNNIENGIFWKSNNDTILGCNDALCHILKKEKREIIGKNVKDIMPNVCAKIDTINKNDSFDKEIEITIEPIPNKKIDLNIKRKKYTNEKNQDAGTVTILSDITEKKRVANEHKRHEQFVVQRSKQSEVGEMLSSIAHQWKAPLVEISAIAQELLYKRKKRDISEQDTKAFVDDIMTQVQYMSSTIDDFRNFIKPSTQKVVFSVSASILSILSIVNTNIKNNYITINLLGEKKEEFFSIGYPNEFKQALLSIINNARDSILKKRESNSSAGKITIELNDSSKGFIDISIKDDGIGIKRENLERIFEPFYTTKQQGDGFGLYMARLLIEDKMQGKIKAIECDNGACIFIQINKH
ncbi:MAG: ATP-binding protein, partial [Sulfurospirillaceae bacterium]|nr:ATP-binding protein [Sulfurospirillaceae bacterium]